jgi:hypothetical protein
VAAGFSAHDGLRGPSASPTERPVTRRPVTLRADRLRIACHVTTELPLLVVTGLQLVHGWRPLYDDAAISYRAWSVFTAHSPLVGHAVAVTGPTVYAPGPLEYWLLAVPVHIDPSQGALWGAALAAVVGMALAIEAAWSVGGRAASVAVSAGLLLLLATRPDLVLNPVWEPALGVVWLATTLVTGWAVATGRIAWWPVNVLAVAVTAQCQEFFAVPAVMLCLLCLPLALRARRRRSVGVPGPCWRPFAWGLVVGAVVWWPAVLNELTGTPGNLSLLWSTAHSTQKRIGLSWALGALASATRPVPAWVHIPVMTNGVDGFFYLVGLLSGPPWWAVVVLIGLLAAAVLARRRGHDNLAVGAAIALVASIGLVMAIADLPASEMATLSYLDMALWPVGMFAWAVLVWALLAVGAHGWRTLARSRTGQRSSGATVSMLSQRWRSVDPTRRRRWTAVTGALPLVVVGLIVLTTSGPQVATTAFRGVGGWSVVRATDDAAALVDRVAPRTPFDLGMVGGASSDQSFSVLTGVAYQLATRGLQPRVLGLATRDFGAWTEAVHPAPSIIIHLPGSLHPRRRQLWVSVQGAGDR